MILPQGPANARLLIASECITYADLRKNTVLESYTFAKMLEEAGIQRSRCFITSLIREQVSGQSFESQVAMRKADITPAHTELHGRMVRDTVIRGLNGLARDIDLVKPKIVLAVGNGALFALTGKWGIKSWRGSMLKYTSPSGHECWVIPTFPPDYINAVWRDRLIGIHDIRKAGKLAFTETPIVEPEYKFIISPTFSEAMSCINAQIARADEALAKGETIKLAVDVETRAGHTACTGFAWSATEAICLPWLQANFQRPNYWAEEEEVHIQYALYKLLTHPAVEVVGQNFIYDAQYFLRHNHYVPNFKRDTMLSQHSMFSRMQKGLDFLSSMYTSHHVYWKDESKNWDPKLGERQLWIYNCKDCCVTYEIDDEQQAAIVSLSSSWPQLPSVHDFQQSMFWPVLATMDRGLRVNNESKSQLANDLAQAIEQRNQWLTEVVGYPINPKSPKQMQDFFYHQMGQKKVINRKSGGVSCDNSALELIAKREPLLKPVCDVIAELRSLNVFKSTFLEAPVDRDQRMRCSFNIAGTDSYRFSSSENAFGSGMNLQNIPTGDEAEGLPNIRKLFICDEEPEPMEYFDVDLDSADLRIVVWESNCLEMKQMFAEGLKPYVEIAKEYYRDPSIDKHHPSYKLFKALCHGTNYLGSASGLASRIGLVAHEIERIQKWYFGKFPEIEDWQKRIKSSVASLGYVENVFGYRMYIFDRIEGLVFNEAIAWIPQSSVACLINRGYRNIHESERDIAVSLQVHDSLAGQYPTRIRDAAIPRIIQHCSVPLPYAEGDLIIPVGIKTSDRSWGDCG